MQGDGERPEPLGGWRGALGRPTWLEVRAGPELAGLVRSRVWRGEGVPPGEGRPVLLVGGFLAGAGTLRVMHTWLSRAGYDVHDTPIGRNAGASEVGVKALMGALRTIRVHTQRRPLVIGHSRGGHVARVAVVRRPDDVAGLVTLGSPHRQALPPHVAVRVPIEALRAASRLGLPWFRWDDEAAFDRDRTAPFPPEVPFWSIWSRSDGLVDWRACLDERARSIEVPGSHTGLAGSEPAYCAIAGVLDDEVLRARW